jgi:hypothetical protein
LTPLTAGAEEDFGVDAGEDAKRFGSVAGGEAGADFGAGVGGEVGDDFGAGAGEGVISGGGRGVKSDTCGNGSLHLSGKANREVLCRHS